MKQNIHRWMNTILTSTLLGAVLVGSYFGVNAYDNMQVQNAHQTEMNQIVRDEGFKACTYKDSLKKDTIGFGHLIKPGEKFSCISAQEALRLLQEDYMNAVYSVEMNYPWASGETKMVLINMTYQMGETGVAKFKKTLFYMKKEMYSQAAMEMLDSPWYENQTGNRAMRLAIRVLSLQG